MNGWDWSLEAECSSCGAKERIAGPRPHVRSAIDRWLGEHEAHEFKIRQRIEKPEAEDQAAQVPEFMRVVPIRDGEPAPLRAGAEQR